MGLSVGYTNHPLRITAGGAIVGALFPPQGMERTIWDGRVQGLLITFPADDSYHAQIAQFSENK
jgi:hypothetical protein